MTLALADIFHQLNICLFQLHCRNPKPAKICYLVGYNALQRRDDNTKIIYIRLLPKPLEQRRDVQRISRFLIDCTKSQLFLRKIFKIEHAEYCCGFNFRTFSKLQTVITIEKLEMPSCRENCWRKSPNWPIRIPRPPTAAQTFEQWVVCSLHFSFSFSFRGSILPSFAFLSSLHFSARSLVSRRSILDDLLGGKEEATRSLG